MHFRWLKHYLPRSLYGRAALILLLPVIFVQLVVSVVFTQRHFEDVTHQMTDATIREVQLVLEAVNAAPDAEAGQAAATQELGALQMVVRPLASGNAPMDAHGWDDISGREIIARMHGRVPETIAVDLATHKLVRLVMKTAHGPFEILFDRRRVSAANPHQLLVNMVFFSILITAIALIYLRNQLRPIKRLANASEAFGRGHHIPYTPAGSTEVRAAGAAFVDMRSRIERQIETRTLMLSGVSHDLRTPLTRMRLGLSMIEDDEAQPLMDDVEEMSGMIDEFLNFARGTSEAQPEALDPVALTRDAVQDARRAGHDVSLGSVSGSGTVMLRPVSIRRALDNLISNGVRYGETVEVSVQITEKSLRFRVEDAGPGIPEDRRVEAVKPFSRLDPARNQDKGSGVGLGLAVATDIARAHGGVLRLSSSEKLGGLQADIVIGL